MEQRPEPPGHPGAEQAKAWAEWVDQAVAWLCQQTGARPRRAMAALRAARWDPMRAAGLLGRGTPGSWDAQRRTGLFVTLGVLLVVLVVGVRTTLVMNQADERFRQRQALEEERARQFMPQVGQQITPGGCLACSGRGSVPCPLCGTAPPGATPNPCPMCAGKGQTACMACGGDGRIDR